MHYSFKSTPTYTIKGRSQTITFSNQPGSRPGPADYNSKKPLPQSATIAHTSQQRNLWKTAEPNPGPGAYESKSYITNGPKRSMSARTIDYSKKTPGPQDYDNNSLIIKSKAPGFSMATKSKSYKQLEFEKNEYKPAATAYESKSTFDKKQGGLIGSSTRKDLTETEKTPAPNYYSTDGMTTSLLNPRCTIGGEMRKTGDFMKGEVTPGPAFYDKKGVFEENKDKKRGFSCREKNPDLVALDISKFPGPGHYDSHLKNKSTAPRCATTQTKRKTFMDDMQDFKKPFPGPGHHEPGFNSSKYRSTSAAPIGRAQRRPLDQNEKTPGPLEYGSDKLKLLNSAPKFSVSKSLAKNEFLGVNPENPGPGYHDPSYSLVKEGSKQYQVGREQRPDFEKHRYSPGPGFYNLRGSEQGPGWSFKQERRLAFTDMKNEAKDSPDYEIPGMVPNPPKYMNVQSKVKYSPSKTTMYSTMNSARRSPEKTSRQ